MHMTSYLGLDLSRFPFFVLRYELTLGERTLDPIMRVIAWSLNAPKLDLCVIFDLVLFPFKMVVFYLHQVQSCDVKIWNIVPTCIRLPTLASGQRLDRMVNPGTDAGELSLNHLH